MGTRRSAVPKAIVCEDEALTSASLAQHCERLGYQVVARPRDGLEAVDTALSAKPDLILMDIRMPGIDGIEAARRILEQHDSTVLIITGYVTDDFVDGAARAGVAGYLVKPVSFDQLHCAVRVATDSVERLQTAVRSAEHAQRALGDRKRIDRAKGVLMDSRGLGEQEAYRLLQKRSQDERRPMADVAEEIIRVRETLRDEGRAE